MKIEKARTHKATVRPNPVVNNNPEYQDVFEIFPATKAMLKVRFHQTAQGLPTM